MAKKQIKFNKLVRSATKKRDPEKDKKHKPWHHAFSRPDKKNINKF